MWELYLITRLDAMLIVFTVVAVGALMVFTISGIDIAHDGVGETNIKVFKRSAWVMAICGTLALLTPTKQDALLIFGLGSTIDYIQGNEKVQQLPDKCVDALDAWVESLSEEKN